MSVVHMLCLRYVYIFYINAYVVDTFIWHNKIDQIKRIRKGNQ